MGALDNYDGLPHLYTPDDWYLVAGRAALVSLIAACQQALRTGKGLAIGPEIDGEGRALHVVCVEPLDSARSPHLPAPEPVRAQAQHALPPRQERPAPTPARVPILAEVPSAFR